MMSCPSFTQDVMTASTISEHTMFDTVLALQQGNQYAPGGGVCNDDHGLHDWLTCPFFNCHFDSLLGIGLNGYGGIPGDPVRSPVIVSSGSGIRVVVVDGYFSVSEGQYQMYLNTPCTMAAGLAGET
jgi:hypothetical protein